MTLSFFDQAQPVLLFAIAGGIVIGLAVFLFARRTAQTPVQVSQFAPAQKQQGSNQPQTQQKPTLQKDTRPRAINFLKDIAHTPND
ncbi:hypothetical protein SAMN05428936_1231 [Pelagibacterium halotolerans]|nr:hypothetical protein SAMN05428936_1231 [Pelagibacterium halotolerans]